MRFTDEEIALARHFRDNGLQWSPQPGHYVYDETGFCKQPSPFQEKVYFILNYPYFMKTVGGVERFKTIMVWLPTWYDAREILRSLDCSDPTILEYLTLHNAFERGDELLALYKLIQSRMAGPAPTMTGSEAL